MCSSRTADSRLREMLSPYDWSAPYNTATSSSPPYRATKSSGRRRAAARRGLATRRRGDARRARAGRVAQRARRAPQAVVAGHVAVAIVVGLEAVDVDHDDRHGL